MKQLFAILLSILVIYSSVKDLVSYADFQINKEFIIENLCINRDNPEAQCDGKCYLRNSLKENRTPDNNQPIQNNEKKTVVYLVTPTIEIVFSIFDYRLPSKIGYKTVNYKHNYNKELLHPPQFT